MRGEMHENLLDSSEKQSLCQNDCFQVFVRFVDGSTCILDDREAGELDDKFETRGEVRNYAVGSCNINFPCANIVGSRNTERSRNKERTRNKERFS